jgi:hypothetical protein
MSSQRVCGRRKKGSGLYAGAYLAELGPLQSSRGDSTPFPVGSDPDIRVKLVGGDDLRSVAIDIQHQFSGVDTLRHIMMT